jgi:hypothetical protein
MKAPERHGEDRAPVTDDGLHTAFTSKGDAPHDTRPHPAWHSTETRNRLHMELKLKITLTALATAVLAVALLVPIAGASGTGTMMGGGGTTDPGTMMGGTWDGTGPWGGTGMWGMTDSGITWLTDDPAAMQAWLQLRTEHLAAMQTWYDTYKADLTSSAAQQALHDLWTEHWNDMQGFMREYAGGTDWTVPAMGMWNGWQMGDMMNGGSWDANHMWGSGYGASWMTSHPAGMGRWLALRGRQMSAVSAWLQQYGADPGSSAAQAAMKTLSARQRSQVKRFYHQHHLSTSASMMRAATGGWMGLGGMWGGFGW